MKSKGVVLLIIAVGLLTFACARQETKTPTSPAAPSSASPNPGDPLAAAKEHYAGKCVVCHGAHGEGGTVKIEDVTLNVPSLKEGSAVKHADEELVKQILDGGDGMPAFKGKLSTKESVELVQLIRKEFQGK